MSKPNPVLIFLILLCCCMSAFAQTSIGELRIKVVDPSGLGIRTSVHITCDVNQYHNVLSTDADGALTVQRLSYGVYQLAVDQAGFAPETATVEVHSSIPVQHTIQLKISAVNESVNVQGQGTLIDPEQAGSVNTISSAEIQKRLSSLPGRSIQDLVNSQPGWLYEGNAVLHPRGSEYQTQFVIDGIPLTDNRSPSFGPEIGAERCRFDEHLHRRLSGRVRTQDGRRGRTQHAARSAAWISWRVRSVRRKLQHRRCISQGKYSWGKNVLGFTPRAHRPITISIRSVPENYTNSGTLGDFSVNYQRDLDAQRSSQLHRPKCAVAIRTAQRNRAADVVLRPRPERRLCQQQNANNFETMFITTYRAHLFAERGRRLSRHGAQQRQRLLFQRAFHADHCFPAQSVRRDLLQGDASPLNSGRNQWKVGVESDNTFLHENFNYNITDPSQFDPGTALTFSLPGAYPSQGQRPDLEQSGFVEDLFGPGNWTINAGVRWDHYQLSVNRNSSARGFAVSRGTSLRGDCWRHFAYDRVFQTPSFENLAPVQLCPDRDPRSTGSSCASRSNPRTGDYYEGGRVEGVLRADNLRADVN